MTAGIIFLSLGFISMFTWIYIEKNTEETWHETSYPRDERGRISGSKTYHYFNRMKNGMVIYTNPIGYFTIISFMIGFVLFFSTLATLKQSGLI
jgi:hypothetical protein